MYNYGSDVTKFQLNNTATGTPVLANGAVSPYKNLVKGAAEFWGNFHPVTLAASANITTASAGATGSSIPALYTYAPAAGNGFQDFTSYGIGAQLGFSGLAGFTLGGSYQDLGRYGTTHGQNKEQDVYSLGAKYEFDKVGVAASWINSSQYNNLLSTTGATATSLTTTNYVSSYNAYGVGAVYTWFPGLTSNADGVIFRQGVDNHADNNDGYVLLVSQRLAF
jgi:hypothetical protein